MKKYLPLPGSVWQDVGSSPPWGVRFLVQLLVLFYVTIGSSAVGAEPLKPSVSTGGANRTRLASPSTHAKFASSGKVKHLPVVGTDNENRTATIPANPTRSVIELSADDPCTPTSYTLCGDKTSFTLTVGSGYSNVQWYRDGIVLPGATGTDYVATQAGLYSYSAVDATTSCSTSLCCPVSIASCTCPPTSYTLCGSKTSFTLTAGAGYTNVQWYKDGAIISGATGMEYVATIAGLYSYSAIEATTGCSLSLCCPVTISSCTCPPASYTLCGTKTSFTLTAGSEYTNVQWYKDGVVIPGATGMEYVATMAGLYSYSAIEATTGCSLSLCCPVTISACPVVCEKPILSLADPICTGNGFYSISLISSTANLIPSAGQVSGASIVNIPIGTPISVTASNGVGCYNVLTADSPTGCSNNGNNNCTPPRLSVGQPLCQGTGFYTVSYRLVGTGSVSSNVGNVNTVSRVIENIPVGQNVQVTATGSGTCVTRVTVVSPASCTNPCENPAITLSGPECVAGSSSYEVSYTVAAGTSVQVNQGVAANGLISGILSGIPVSVTVTPNNGCQPIVVIVPPASCTVCTALGLNTGTTLAQCGQANGIATVVVNAGSGVAPYTYQWTNASGSVVSSSSLAQGLAPGVYTVSVTDSKGCTGQKQVSISSTSAPLIVAQVNSTSCGLANGSASVQVSNGSGNYSYQWTSAAGIVVGSSASLMNLSAGTYMVSVSDGSGCSSMTSVVVGNSTPLNVVASVQNAVCGQATGSVSAQVSGGSPAYSYQWRNAAGSVVATSQNLTNASPGSYTVIVTDATGCTALASANISNLAGPQLAGSVTNVSCYGTQTGGVVLSVTGGTPPIGYVWSNGATTKDLSNVGAGVYTVTARDANGCVAIQSFTISQPTEIAAVFQPTQPTCTSLTGGSVRLIGISGGTTPYSYTWSNGSTASSLSGLSGGTYTLTIKDANGCVASPVAILATPTGCSTPVFDLALTKKLASGQSANVTAGSSVTFTVTVYNKGNVDATNVQVTDYIPTGLTLNDASWSASNGLATLNSVIASLPAGQSTTRNIVFTVGAGVTGSITNTAEISSAGNAQNLPDVDSDADNNPDNDGTPINDDTSGDHKHNPSQDEDDSDIEVINVTPSCVALGLNTGTTLAQCGQANGIATVVVNAGSGTAPYTYQWTNASGSVVSSSSLAQGLAPGVYTVSVTDSKGCTGQKQVSISSTSAPLIVAQVNSTSCGLANGSASVQVTSGSGSYTYQWTNGSGAVVGTTASISNLSAGTYMVSVSDGSGCSSMTSVVVGNSTPLNVVASVQNAVCGQATGSVSAQVSGGSPAYSYQWRNAAGSVVATSQNLTNASPGSYTVIVTDATGCTALASANISNLAGPQLAGSVTNVSCYGTQTGGVVLSVTGGTPPIGYVWSNGATTKDLSNVGAGVYTVTARDANGCVAIQSFTISQPTEIAAVFQPTQPTCTSLTGGSVRLIGISGGTTPYSYTWSNGSTASSLSGLSGGTYTLTIKDANGCVASPVAILATPTGCSTPVFDLALTKKLASGQSANVTAGSSVTFTVTVYNKGNVDATNVQVTDYIPTGLTLNDASWSASNGLATLNSVIISLPAGQSTTRNIVFTVGSGVTGSLTNTAEISSAGNAQNLPDVDSDPDNNPDNDGTPINDDISGDHKHNPSQDEDDSDVEVINVTPVTPVCEKPVLTVGNPVCNPANGTYSVSVYSSTASVLASAGSMNLSAGLISNIQVGTPVSVTASNGAGCFQVLSVDSPASCLTNPSCTQPKLTVGQPICQGTGYYSVNFTAERGSVQISQGRIVGNNVVDIPLGTNLLISATDGSCFTRVMVMSPASCTNVCENPAISLSGPICDDKGTSTYYLNYTVTAGATVRVNPGYANGHWIYGIPSGVPLSVTVSTPGCADKVVTIPGIVCGQTPQPLLELTKQVNKTRAALGEVVTYTLTLTNKGTGAATNVEVQESMSAGLAIVPGSVSTTMGSYAATSPVGIWTIPSLAAGATTTLTFSASVTQVGVVYNKAAIPGDTVSVCTTVPVKVCKGAPILVDMSAPAGYGSYQWYRNGVPVAGATSYTYTASQYGEFTVQVNGGQCPNGACCPIVIEEEVGVSFTLAALAPTCNGSQPLANGTVTIGGLSAANTAYRYAISQGGSFTTTNPALQAVPANGVLASNLVGGQTYTIRLFNGAGCWQDQTVTVGVANCGCQVEPPVVTCAITEICKGSSTVLSTRGCESGTVIWSDGKSGATIVATPSVTTTYTASCVIGTCVSKVSNAITVTVLDVKTPVLTASADNVCPGTSVTLTATGCESGTVIWSDKAQTGNSIVVAPYGKTTYTAQCRQSACLSAPALITINVNTDLPTPTVTCSTTIVCPGETVTLTAENCVGTPIWNSTTATTSSIVVTPTLGSNRYWVYCKNGACTSKSSNVYTIEVVAPQVPTLSASADTVCLGGSVVLTASGCNGSVLWSTGETGASITARPTANTSYYAQCKFRTCLSNQSSPVAIAVVNPQAPIVKVSKTLICSGEPVSLTATGCNGTVQWHGVARVGSVITIYPTESKEYYATCKQGTCESSASNTVRVTVNTSPATAPTVTASTTLICNSGVVSLTATGCNGNVTWSDGQTGSVVTVTPTPTNREFYALCVPTSGTACGSAKSNVIAISVAQPGVPSIVASRTAVCAGETLTLTASGCNGSVKWSNGQLGATIQVSPQTTTDYQATCSLGACESALSSKVTVVVTPAAPAPVVTASSLTVCSGSVVSLTATGCTGTVTWSDGQTGSVVTVTPTAASHDFSAICQTGGSCRSPQSNVVSITLAPTAAPTITASRNVVCSGEKVTLTATGCAGTVTWSGINRLGASIDIYPTSTTEYYATCNVGSCVSAASNKVTVTVNTGTGTIPVVTASTQQVCTSGVVSLTATGCSSGTVIWSDGQTGAIVSVTATEASHEFYALCKDAGQCGTGKSNVITITVTTMQTPVAVCSTDSICAGEEVTLTVQNCQGTPHWSTGETTPSIIVKPMVTTGYTVYCSLNGCTSPTSKSYLITVVPVLEPTITASATAVEPGGTVTLTATGCPGTVIWSANDIHGNNTGSSIVVRPEGTQTYSAQCKYRTCLSDPSITIVVNPGTCVAKAGGLTPVNATVCGSGSNTVIVAATPSGGLVQPSGYSVAYLLTKDGLVQQVGTTPQFSVPSAVAQYVIHTLVYNSQAGDANYLNLAYIKSGLSRTTDVLQLISGKCAALDATGAKLTVGVVNAPTLSATALTVCNGGTVSLTATGCSGSVKWSDGKEGAVYETSVYSDRTLTAICEVAGCASQPSAPVRITLGSPAVPVIVSTPSICVGETVSLTATGCADGAYLWSDGSTTGAILTVTPSADVTYRVKCKLGACEGDWSASATVRVGKPSAPTLSLQGAGSATVCYGMPVTLVATGCSASEQVIWSNNLTGSSITLSPASTETYTAYCASAAGTCRSDVSAGITLTVLPKVAVPTVVDKTNTCPITTVDLSTGVTSPVSTAGGVFEYYTDATLTSKVANPAAVGAGTYYVIERTVNGCVSLPAIIHVQITTCTEPTPCDGVNPATADAGADVNLCSTTSYQLRGVLGGGGQTAHWTTSGSGHFDNPYSLSAIYTASAEDVAAGQVTLTLAVSTTNVNCPIATDQMVLTLNGVKTQPVITIVGATQLCYGDSVTLKASEASGYRWSTGAITRSIVVKQSGIYSVQVMDDKGCVSVKSAEVTVKVADPVLPPLVTNLRNTCPSKIVDLTKALSTTTAGSSYSYRICECVTSNIVIRPDSVCEGTYWIVEKTAQGCVSHPSKVVVKVFDCASDTLRSDVSITKTVNHTVVNGTPVTYTLTVSNAGPHTAYNVDVRDVLPSGLQLLPSAGYSFVNGVITKRIDSLKAGASAQIVFSARLVKKGEDVVNRAEITYQDHVDPNLSNNSSSITVRDTATAPASQTGTAGLGLALAVVKVEAQPDNSYNVTYKGTIKNIGGIDLQGLSLVDSLSQVFLSPASYSVVGAPVVASGSTLVANASFNGHTQPDLLTGASTLAAGAQDEVVFVVNVKPNGNNGPFYSSATVTGTTPDASQTVMDISNNGIDPVADGAVVTTVRFDLPQGLLGIAKEAGTPIMVAAGVYDVPYTITLTNMGSLPLRQIQVVDNLTQTFGSGALIVSNRIRVTGTGTVTVDTLYTGQGLLTRMLVDTASTLAVGAKATLGFTVRVDVRSASPQSSSLTFYNTAYGTALASDNQVVADTSTAGANTDPDNDLDPRNNSQSTPVSLNGLTTDAHIGLAMTVADTVRQSDGSYNVTYQIVVKAYGPSPLKNVLVTDTLSTVFNSQTGSSFTLVKAPFITSTGSALKLNPNYNGVSDPVIVLGDSTSALAVGKVDTIRMVINVIADGSTTSFLNSAYGLAQYTGGTVSDVSTSGLNPDLNGNGDPTDPNEREATPLTLLPTYQAIFIPQGFSPNGDGINDRFVIRGANGLTVSLEVYNRWGNLVYKNEDYQNDWDGKPNTGIVLSSADSNGVPDGTYYYVVNLSDGRKFVRYMTINR
ncbi:T9SS type B sorting domain-containing protein [Spirosoma aerolatum]|uniref:T9SS type B sorting domain-containing protein n=1 Tax=Spirosoma aerolatum TaxID=1211326 RepID=UPI00147318CD|nr:gliding motility-associated C-terminal domain-containing protein [Spirosoma aerolatum]